MRKDKVYILNPHYHLRDDRHRVILFSRGMDGKECSLHWQSFIHPVQAAFLSFFTYLRPYEQTLAALCDFFACDEAEMNRMVQKFVENPQPVFVRLPEGKTCFPKRVLVETDERAVQGLVFAEQQPENFTRGELDLNGHRIYTGPTQITLMLNNRCLTRCRYCYADTHTQVRHPLSTERILELIEEAAVLPVQQVALMGGEVFLHKDWQKILTVLVARDMAPDFLSTKIPMTDELVRQIEATGYRGVVQVSLDTCDERIARDLLGVTEGYVERMIRGLMRLDQSTLNYQVASVLTTYNCQIEILSALYKTLSGLKRIRDWRIVPVQYSISKGYQVLSALRPDREQLQNVFDRLEEKTRGAAFPVIMNRQAIENHFRSTPISACSFTGSKCSALTTHLFILPDGKVTICEQLYWNPRFVVGDVTTDSLLDVWNSDRVEQLRCLDRKTLSSDSECRECPIFEQCYSERNRCWTEVIKAYGEDCWDYPDPRCELAPELNQNIKK